ncbi:MAG: DNA mismatch repair endonuclease MutL [Candidatus Woesearchaeota archaeon]
MAIKLLDEKTINKIAAGEVIERPSSIVKELIENSIDANSKNIQITINDAGKELIIIEDDGIGMNEEDLIQSVLRHATSKILDFNDLFNIKTMGFRGEALSSIAAVSKLTIITKQKNNDLGVKIDVLNGKIINKEYVAFNHGTKIIVKDLFYNVPARKKFLKNTLTEKKLVMDIVVRYALIHNGLKISLNDEKSNLLNKPITNNLKENLAYVYGHEIAKESISYSDKFIDLVLVKPTINRSTKDYISVYVNQRFVKSKIIENAIIDCLKTFLFHGKFPIVVINLKIDPKKIDVNVHPSKKIIKFDDEVFIYQEVFDVIKSVIEKNDLFSSYIKGDNSKKEYSKNFFNLDKTENFKLNKNDYNKSFDNLKSSYFSTKKPIQKVFDPITNYDVNFKSGVSKNNLDIGNTFVKNYNVLGQIHKTYIVIETDEGYELIDQHAMHERIMYEKFKKQINNKKVIKQNLLSSITLDFDFKEFLLIKENIIELKEFGFYLEEFGKNSFILRKVPYDLLVDKKEYHNLIIELAEKLSNKRNVPLNEQCENALKYMACRSAIKAGKELSIVEMNKLIDELFTVENKYTCPHGRPTIIKYPISKIEEQFKRK